MTSATRIPLTCVAAALAAATALTSPALAAKSTAKSAKFTASLSGDQVVKWTYDRPQTDQCSGSETGSGQTTMEFGDRSGTVTALLPSRSNPAYRVTHGKPLVATTLKASVTLRRTGTHTVVPAPVPPCDGVGDGTGDGPAAQRCGTRGNVYRIGLDFKAKDNIRLTATPNGRWAGGRNESALGDTFDNCPSWITGPYAPAESDGAVEPFGVYLKKGQKQLFSKKAKRITIKGKASFCYSQSGDDSCAHPDGSQFHGQVTTNWTLELKRVK